MSARAGRALLMLLATLAWLGVGLQLLVSMRLASAAGRPALAGMLDALCYFTVLTNVLVATVSTARAMRAGSAPGPGMLAATAVYIFVVGLIYTLLLRALWAPSGLHKLADALLHDLVPVLYVLWWICCAPHGQLRWRQPAWWLLYPLAYFAFSVLLGSYSGRYLYPFADIGTLGIAAVLRNAVFLLALFLALGLAAVSLDRALGRRQAP